MSHRDQLRAAIDRIPDDRLAELLALVRGFEPPADPPTLLDTLRGITIDAPPEFASTFRDRPPDSPADPSPPPADPPPGPASFLRTARSMRLDLPTDFATNLDDYLYGGRAADAS